MENEIKLAEVVQNTSNYVWTGFQYQQMIVYCHVLGKTRFSPTTTLVK